MHVVYERARRTSRIAADAADAADFCETFANSILNVGMVYRNLSVFHCLLSKRSVDIYGLAAIEHNTILQLQGFIEREMERLIIDRGGMD